MLICLEEGTYTGFSTTAIDLVIGNPVTIRGAGAHATVLQGTPQDFLLHVNELGGGLENLTVTGFETSSNLQHRIAEITTTGGLSVHNVRFFNCDSRFGAIRNKGTLTVTSSVFDNVDGTNNDGGMMWISDGGHTSMTDTVITNCDVPKNGIILVEGSSLELHNVVAYANTPGWSGGVAHASTASAITVTGSTFHSLIPGREGGAIYIDSGSLTMSTTNCSWNGPNTTSRNGGCIYASGATVSITDSVFDGNSVATDGVGSAVYASGGTLDVTSCLFVDNSGEGTVVYTASATGTIHSSVLINNAVGPALSVTGSADVTVYNSTLSHNSATGASCDTASLTLHVGTIYCDNAVGDVAVNSCSLTAHVSTTAACSARCALPTSACVPYFPYLTTGDPCDPGEAPTHCYDCHLCPIDECALGLDDCTASEVCVDKHYGWHCSSACDTGNCDPLASCNATVGSFTCTCPAGYTTSNDGVNCTDVDECGGGGHNCDTGGVAVCVNNPGSFSCDCPGGYASGGGGTNCSNVDECGAGSHNCDLLAACADTAGSFTCSCPSGYNTTNGGVNCTDVDECAVGSHDCDTLAACSNADGGYVCTCLTGYNTTDAGATCTDVDECAVGAHDCDPLASCANSVGSFSCSCPSGYNTTNGGVNCTDVDECAVGSHDCDTLAACSNIGGGYVCTCPTGYNTTDDGATCTDVDECAVGAHDCDPLASCANSPGSFSCTCPTGYFTSDSGASCDNTDECGDGSHNCDSLADCTNTAGSFTCACPTGYTASGGGASCSDTDECGGGTHNCDALASCSNTAGSFGCTCPTGYTSTTDGVDCEDIDECALGTHTCTTATEACNNTAGSFSCVPLTSSGFNVSTSGVATTEAGGTVVITVRLTAQPTADITVAVSVSDSSEASVSPAVLSFSASESAWADPAVATVTGLDDSLVDGSVGYSVNFGAPVTADPLYAAESLASIVLVNLDDDTAGVTGTVLGGANDAPGCPTSSASGDATVCVFENGTSPLALGMALTAEPASAVVFNITVATSANDTSVSGPPVTLSTHTLVFEPADWVALQTVYVTGRADNRVGDTAFDLDFAVASSPAEFAALSFTVHGLRLDDDSAGVVVSAPLGAFTNETGASTTVNVSLTSQPVGPVTVTLAVSDSSEGFLPSPTALLTPSNWAAGVAVAVDGVDDTVLDFIQFYDVYCVSVASVADPDYGAGLDCSGARAQLINVDNDDSSLLQLSLPSATLYEATAGTAFSFVYVVLTADPDSLTVTTTATSADTSEVVVSGGASLSFTSANYYVPQYVVATAVDEYVDDGDTQTALTVAATGIANSARSVSVTVVDDDTAGTIVVSGPSGHTNELGATATFSLRLSSQPTASVTLDLSSEDKTEGVVRAATASLTYTAANWAVAQTVTVVGVSDNLNGDGDVAYAIRVRAKSPKDQVYHGLTTTVGLVNDNVVWPKVSAVLESELSVLLGWPMAFEGKDFVPGCSAFIGGELVRNLTWVSAKRLEFVSPVQTEVGYYDYAVVNPDGGRYDGPADIFYTDDCPYPGQYGRGLDCVDCPEGAICPGGYRIWPDEGYWNPGETSGYVVACDPPERCRGGPDAKCAKGYTGKLCGACAEGYYLEGKVCVPCSAPDVGIFLVIVDVVLYVAFVAAALFMPNQGFQAAVHILSMLQVLRMIGRMNIGGMPSFMIAFYRFLAVSTGEGVRESGCTTGSSLFIYSFFLNYGLLIAVILAIASLLPALKYAYSSAYVTANPARAAELVAFYSQRQVSAFVVFSVFAYVNITTLNIQAVHCYRIASGELILGADNTVTCFTGAHIPVFVVGSISLLLFTIGFPLGAGVAMYKRKAILWNASVLSRFGFLYKDFERSYYLHQVAWLLLLCVNAVAVATMSRHQFFQLLIVGSLLLAFFSYVVVARPFIEIWKTAALAVILFVATAGLVYNYLVYVGSYTNTFVLTTFEALVFTGVIIAFGVMIAQVFVVIRSMCCPERAPVRGLKLGSGRGGGGVVEDDVELPVVGMRKSVSFAGHPRGSSGGGGGGGGGGDSGGEGEGYDYYDYYYYDDEGEYYGGYYSDDGTVHGTGNSVRTCSSGGSLLSATDTPRSTDGGGGAVVRQSSTGSTLFSSSLDVERVGEGGGGGRGGGGVGSQHAEAMGRLAAAGPLQLASVQQSDTIARSPREGRRSRRTPRSRRRTQRDGGDDGEGEVERGLVRGGRQSGESSPVAVHDGVRQATGGSTVSANGTSGNGSERGSGGGGAFPRGLRLPKRKSTMDADNSIVVLSTPTTPRGSGAASANTSGVDIALPGSTGDSMEDLGVGGNVSGSGGFDPKKLGAALSASEISLGEGGEPRPRRQSPSPLALRSSSSSRAAVGAGVGLGGSSGAVGGSNRSVGVVLPTKSISDPSISRRRAVPTRGPTRVVSGGGGSSGGSQLPVAAGPLSGSPTSTSLASSQSPGSPASPRSPQSPVSPREGADAGTGGGGGSRSRRAVVRRARRRPPPRSASVGSSLSSIAGTGGAGDGGGGGGVSGTSGSAVVRSSSAESAPTSGTTSATASTTNGPDSDEGGWIQPHQSHASSRTGLLGPPGAQLHATASVPADIEHSAVGGGAAFEQRASGPVGVGACRVPGVRRGVSSGALPESPAPQRRVPSRSPSRSRSRSPGGDLVLKSASTPVAAAVE